MAFQRVPETAEETFYYPNPDPDVFTHIDAPTRWSMELSPNTGFCYEVYWTTSHPPLVMGKVDCP